MSSFGRQTREPFPASAATELTVLEGNQTKAKNPQRKIQIKSQVISADLLHWKGCLVFNVKIKSLHVLHFSVVLAILFSKSQNSESHFKENIGSFLETRSSAVHMAGTTHSDVYTTNMHEK